jgi:hypothetical protein
MCQQPITAAEHTLGYRKPVVVSLATKLELLRVIEKLAAHQCHLLGLFVAVVVVARVNDRKTDGVRVEKRIRHLSIVVLEVNVRCSTASSNNQPFRLEHSRLKDPDRRSVM